MPNPFLGLGFNSWSTKYSRGSASSGGGGATSDKIVIGAPNDDVGSNGDQGSAYIYNLDGTSEVKLTASDGAAGDGFGYSVALGNDKVVVGAYADDINLFFTETDQGSIYVYDLDGTNEVKLTSGWDGASNDKFGSSVAVGSNKIVVGAPGDGSSSGSVYVYDLGDVSAPGYSVNYESKITASDGAASDIFGTLVAVGNDKIVVGAPGDGSSSGSVYVYDLDGTNEVKITASDGAASDQFGISVAVGSNKIVVGAYQDDDNGSSSGSVYIYNLDGTGEAKITASDGAAGDNYGYSVSVGNDKVVVGAWGDDINLFLTNNDQGSIYVYDLDGTNEVKLTSGWDGASNDKFGSSVAVGSNKIVVGAPGDGSSSGSVYVYDLGDVSAPGYSVNYESKINASDAAAGDKFGHSVSVA